MNQILAIMFAAKAKMPASIPPADTADILLTLLFWKMMSDWACRKATRFYNRYHQPSPEITAIRQQNHIIFNDASLYGACQWQNPQDACLAIRDSLYCWANLQAGMILHGVLRPERFGRSSPHYTLFSSSTVLAEVVQLIGNLSFDDGKPVNPVNSVNSAALPMTIGEIFSKVVDILEIMPQALPLHVTQLVVDVLAPLPMEHIVDPACGEGQLLLACATDMEQRVPRHQLFLQGNVAEPNRFALAGMQLLAHGLRLFTLNNTGALSTPAIHKVPDPMSVPLPSADVVLTRIPDVAQEWDYASAAATGDARRFPLGPPHDSRIALIWHGLSHLGHADSRMGLLLSLAMLDSPEGLTLRRHLVQQHQLEAIIELPGVRRSGLPLSLLVVRRENPFNTVAFISGRSVVPKPAQRRHQDACDYDVASALCAYRAYRSLQCAPCLHVIDYPTLATHDHAFHLAAYDAWLNSGKLPPLHG